MSGRGFLDLRVPMFRPLWTRAAATGLTLGWAGFEAWNGQAGWALLFGAAGAYLGWALLLVWDPAALDRESDSDSGGDSDGGADR